MQVAETSDLLGVLLSRALALGRVGICGTQAHRHENEQAENAHENAASTCLVPE